MPWAQAERKRSRDFMNVAPPCGKAKMPREPDEDCPVPAAKISRWFRRRRGLALAEADTAVVTDATARVQRR